MARFNYERLGAQDNAFLLWETPNLPMHVSSTCIFQTGPLRTEEGGIDFAKIRAALIGNLHRIPRYRQKLQWIPGHNHAVWVDDPHFQIDYHLRHASLPRPGSDEQLKRLSSRIMAHSLDRERPLWETWVVEGLSDDRFALILKIHHCMIDGAAGVDLAQILFSTTKDSEIPEPTPFIPRPAPTPLELLRDEVGRTLSMPVRAVRSFRQFRRETGDLSAEIGTRLRALASLARWGVSDTPINGPVGPHRTFDWLTMPLSDVKDLKNALDCTVNDAVLTIVTGAFRSYMERRQVRPEDLQFTIQAPVSVRRENDRGKLGNRVSNWTIDLPIGEPDPLLQLQAIRETTRQLKESKQALGVETIITIAEWTTSSLLSLGAQAATGTTNSLVTNVPGPQFPLYFMGAEQLAMYPQAPLLPNVGLSIAMVSYNGQLCWGFTADSGRIPDLADFVSLIRDSYQRLCEAALAAEANPAVRLAG